MCVCGRRHSLHCILPPYILSQIAQNGSQEERQNALKTLSTDASFRTLRAIRLAVPSRGVNIMVGVIPELARSPGQPLRIVHDSHGKKRLNRVRVVRREGAAPVTDDAVNEAYDGLGVTYEFYWQMLQRHSIDGQGMPLHAYVHYGQHMDNAFWDGRQMVFGDGDGELFNRFTLAVDVIGHELTHGVTENETQMIYHGESGALNESLSDVFGSLIKQYGPNGSLRQPANQADWLIGAGLFTSRVQGRGIRSMSDPGSAFDDPVLGKDPQPSHMKDYVHTMEDNGGVHINSGIPNKAFYLTAMALGGYAGDQAGRIWYAALRDPGLHADATFVDFAQLCVRAAGQLYPGSNVQHAVQQAWGDVGVL